MALADELRDELERIDRQIELLQAERDALRRVLKRTGAKAAAAGQQPPDKPVPLREAVATCVAATPGGLRMVQIIERLQATLPWTAGSIRTAVYRLNTEGYLIREGHLWKSGSPL